MPLYNKRIGILGGISPQSTLTFYELLIKKHFQMHKNEAYPEIVIFSVNFEKIVELAHSSDTQYIQTLANSLDVLAKAGADFIVIASNAVHKILDELRSTVRVPILSIIDATLNQAKKDDLQKLLLLGTKQTMSGSFYQKEAAKKKIDLVTPNSREQDIINKIIFQELTRGTVNSKSKRQILDIISNYDTEGVILGCTELQMIIKPEDTSLLLLDTLKIHVEATLAFAATIAPPRVTSK